MNQKKKDELFSTIMYMISVLIVAFLIRTFIITLCSVNGESMMNEYKHGDLVLVQRSFCSFDRFDVIVFDSKNKSIDNRYIIKRIIGLPGETVQIIDSEIYINGVQIFDQYKKDLEYSAGLAEIPIVLGENEYFVLGDNRNNSLDSRYSQIGIVTKDEILGEELIHVKKH